MSVELFSTGLLQGILLAIIAMGIMISFRILNFADLSAEGSYPLGGAVYASLILIDIPQIIALFIAICAGGLLSFSASQISLKMKVNSLLAGIIVSTMVYSINLKIMGKPNIALFNYDQFSLEIISSSIILLFCLVPLFIFLKTDYGLRLRAVGLNQNFASKNYLNVNKYTGLGLFISGGFFALSGSFMVMVQRYMDVGMGVGIVIHGLAALMIGETLIGNDTLKKQLLAPIIGALIYQQLQGIILSLGLAPTDLKFFTGAIVLLVIGFSSKNNQL